MTQGTVASAISAYREGLVVLRDLETECGFWFVPMPPEDLEALWLAQESFDQNPDGSLDLFYTTINQVPPPHTTLILPGHLVIAESQEDVDLWRLMAKEKKYYMCFICCDADSYLKRPDGTILLSRCSPGEGQPHPRVKLPRP